MRSPKWHLFAESRIVEFANSPHLSIWPNWLRKIGMNMLFPQADAYGKSSAFATFLPLDVSCFPLPSTNSCVKAVPSLHNDRMAYTTSIPPPFSLQQTFNSIEANPPQFNRKEIMKYAMVNGRRTHARNVSSGTIGHDLWFPDQRVRAHVGRYLQYWVYIDRTFRIPPGYEPESDWHAKWKGLVNDEFTEVVQGNNNEHRADILINDQVVEIQKTRIDIRDAEERVRFYRDLFPNKRVVWLINIHEIWSMERLRIGERHEKGKNTFKLIWPKSAQHKWMVDLARTTETDVFFDVSDGADALIKVWVHANVLSARWCKKKFFFQDYLQNGSLLSPADLPSQLGFRDY